MHQQKRPPKRLAIIALILTLSVIFAAHAAAEDTTVYVDAPEYVLSGTFDVEIKIKDVHELDSGEFHLLFDPNVVDVTGVTAGDIGAMNIVFTNKRSDKIQGIGIIAVTFDISGTSGVSGSGSLATVGFDVAGTDGTCSFLNISNPNPIYNPITDFYEGKLWDISTEEITAKWENGVVCIGDPSSFDDPPDSGNSTDSNTSLRDTPEAKVTIFVENRDDDDLFVKLSIDGDFLEQEEIKDGDNKRYYEGRRMPEGVHIFKIEWHDHDTGKDYVKTKECSVSGITAVTLMTDEHTEDDDKLSARVYVKNLDDDVLNEVYLYIDGEYRKYKSISSGSIVEYDEYEFEKDEDALHSFRIEWFDPGTNVTYEKIVRSYITGEEAVTLYVDRHTEADIILLSEDTPTPVSTISRSASTSTSTVKESTHTPTETQITEMHTDPALTQDHIENSGMGQHISATCTLIAFVSVLFVLMQIRRI
ncbi:MAG: cohesin domain-containing protein [Euryarchaeota archaeon]|nr:cohesin domain-containing protein [Euryarchaeota archaeon]